jgi:hypothetical protein
MLSVLGRSVRLCDGITRREALRVGGLGFSGLLWSDCLRARAAANQPRAPRTPAGGFGAAQLPAVSSRLEELAQVTAFSGGRLAGAQDTGHEEISRGECQPSMVPRVR